VRTALLQRCGTTTFCAYKGKAYWSLGDDHDLASWYPEPLREAAEVTDRIAFFNERVDLLVDGAQQERPVTPRGRPGRKTYRDVSSHGTSCHRAGCTQVRGGDMPPDA
jgi:hypothetical protein